MSHSWSLFVVCCLLMASLGCSAYGQADEPAAKARRGISPWIIYHDETTIDALKANADIIDSVSVCGGPPRAFVDQCHELGIKVYKLMGGHDGAVFETPEARKALIQIYLDLCRERNLDGIDLDFENIENQYRDAYSALMREASAALHADGRRMSMCVSYLMNTWRNVEGPQPGIGGIDWCDPAVIGETCDMVRVMCYDMFSTSGRAIGPVSTRPWARDAMAFWATQVPREKLVMGLPAYSRDFRLTPNVDIQSPYLPLPDLPEGTELSRIWLAYEGINTYRYTDEQGALHLFYASDAASTKEHLATVDELDIPAIAFWHYGSVVPETWQAVREWLQAPE